MRIIKTFFAVLCFGLGAAFAISTADKLLHPPDTFSTDLPASWVGMFAAMFLLGSFLLLRRTS
jgi:amino acid permease